MPNSVDPNPKVWGPPLWKKLHKITFDYPEHINNNNSQRCSNKKTRKGIIHGIKIGYSV